VKGLLNVSKYTNARDSKHLNQVNLFYRGTSWFDKDLGQNRLELEFYDRAEDISFGKVFTFTWTHTGILGWFNFEAHLEAHSLYNLNYVTTKLGELLTGLKELDVYQVSNLAELFPALDKLNCVEVYYDSRLGMNLPSRKVPNAMMCKWQDAARVMLMGPARVSVLAVTEAEAKTLIDKKLSGLSDTDYYRAWLSSNKPVRLDLDAKAPDIVPIRYRLIASPKTWATEAGRSVTEKVGA
jgi:hypothetical protein